MSAGEILLGRELRSEVVAGAQHYVPGQHAAKVTGRGADSELLAELSYVDGMGRAVLAACVKPIGGRWACVGYAAAGHHTRTGPHWVGRSEGFVGEVGLRRLDEAEERWRAES